MDNIKQQFEEKVEQAFKNLAMLSNTEVEALIKEGKEVNSLLIKEYRDTFTSSFPNFTYEVVKEYNRNREAIDEKIERLERCLSPISYIALDDLSFDRLKKLRDRLNLEIDIRLGEQEGE